MMNFAGMDTGMDIGMDTSNNHNSIATKSQLDF